MAVQKHRVSRAKRNMRRLHDRLAEINISVDPVSGENHLRHHVTKDGYYRGRQLIKSRNMNYSDDEE